jgi:hypothetical protein
MLPGQPTPLAAAAEWKGWIQHNFETAATIPPCGFQLRLYLVPPPSPAPPAPAAKLSLRVSGQAGSQLAPVWGTSA